LQHTECSIAPIVTDSAPYHHATLHFLQIAYLYKKVGANRKYGKKSSTNHWSRFWNWRGLITLLYYFVLVKFLW